MKNTKNILAVVLAVATIAAFPFVGTGCTNSKKTDEENSLVTTINDYKEKVTEADRRITYVLNAKTKKFHVLSCSWLPYENRVDTNKSREEIITLGYSPCMRCNP